jgi:hypothetical protein
LLIAERILRIAADGSVVGASISWGGGVVGLGVLGADIAACEKNYKRRSGKILDTSHA